MKNKILVSLITIAGLTACNDDFNDQFNIVYNVNDVKSMVYTLDPSDYGSIADNENNVFIATGKDPAGLTYVKALADVKKNKYFTSEAPAEEYIPAFLDAKYPNADVGSKFVVTFNQYEAPSAYMTDFANISEYTLAADDYKTVWGTSVNASFLSPLSLQKLPTILKSKVSGAQDGDMVVVNYAYSEVEPSTGGTQGVVYDKISDVIANTSGASYTVKGNVIATYGRGFLINDGTASILVYLNAASNYYVGDVVSVSGTTSSYSKLMQFPATSEVKLLERKTTFAYPTSSQLLAGAELDNYMTSPSVKYIRIQGTLTISGSYYNIVVDGATRKGSISYPVAGVVDAALNGKVVDVTGYAIGGSSTYVNIMATSVVEAGQTSDITPVGVVALSAAGAYTVSGVVAATYAKGFLVTDGTGNILVYLNKAHDYVVGDIVNVSGTTSKYANLMQFPATSVVTKGAHVTFTNPAPRTLAATDMEAYLTATYCGNVSYTGTLSISGSYYNVTIDGTTAVQGSLSYPITGVVDPALNGKKVLVTGYAIGVSSGKYLNTMVTSIVEAPAARSFASASRVAVTVAPNKSELYVYSSSQWKKYTNSDVLLGVITPEVYSSLGSNTIATPENVVPTFLQNTYPYVVDGEKAVAIYKDKSKNYIAKEYTFNKYWSLTPDYLPVTLTFAKDESGISANMSTYVDETFLGDEGDFKAYNVTLGSLSYVWINTAAYGWKASAFLNNTNNVSDSYLVSPSINLLKATSPIMTFDEAHKYLNGAQPTQYLSVLVSKNFTGDPAACTWDVLPVAVWSDGSTWDFVNVGEIDLSAYKGSRINIAFRYTSDASAAATWEVKNLKVIEKESAN